MSGLVSGVVSGVLSLMRVQSTVFLHVFDLSLMTPLTYDPQRTSHLCSRALTYARELSLMIFEHRQLRILKFAPFGAEPRNGLMTESDHVKAKGCSHAWR